MEQMCLRCPGCRQHVRLEGKVRTPAGWKNSTALAAEYPVKCCDMYAKIAVSMGVIARPVSVVLSSVIEVVSLGRALPEGFAGSETAELQRCQTPWELAIAKITPFLDWRAKRSWKDLSNAHINILEFRVWAKLVQRYASQVSKHHHRLVSLWHSRVGLCSMLKGRSSSQHLLREHREVLPHILGGDLECTGFWIPTRLMPMDGPSRSVPIDNVKVGVVPKLNREFPLVPQCVLSAWAQGHWNT
jgi:hypothetical protein